MSGPTEDQFLALGMEVAGVFRWQKCKLETNLARFCSWYGVHPSACQRSYDDLVLEGGNASDDQIKIVRGKDKPIHLLMICRFLYLYPNEKDLGQFFKIWSRNTVLKYTKVWLKRLRWLLIHKLGNIEDYDEGLIMMLTLDCTHCPTEEPRPFSTDNSSHKLGGSAGVNYELGILIHRPKLIWVHGPTQPGKLNDVEVFRSKLKREMMDRLPGRKAIADKGYRGEEGMLVLRNDFDPPELAEFKDRALARHEVFNGMVKQFDVLTKMWRHITICHGDAFRSCCVLVMYQLESGARILFDPYPVSTRSYWSS